MGAWIEICHSYVVDYETTSRTPRWVRGLKLSALVVDGTSEVSHPTMGAWIEIFVR